MNQQLSGFCSDNCLNDSEDESLIEKMRAKAATKEGVFREQQLLKVIDLYNGKQASELMYLSV